MSKTLDPAAKKAVSDRLHFYRDLGIYDFFSRPVSPEALAEITASATATDETQDPMATPKKAPAAKLVSTSSSAANPLPVLTDRVAALKAIREHLGDCTRCVLHKQGRKQIVFGVGNVNADIMFIGEGPGADEDQQGEPFVGRAGQLLNNMIVAMGIRREDVYIANIVKCRPPGNRNPERDECDTCSPFLMRQIAVVQPKVIVALGAVAAKTLLAVNDTMANLRGRFYDFTPHLPADVPERAFAYNGAQLAVTYHPAYLLRDPRQKKEAWKDLQMVMKHLGLKPPAKSE